METPPQITFKNLSTSDALEQHIRKRIDRLERRHRGLIGCRVVIEEPHKSGAHHNDPLSLAVEVDVPGSRLVAKGGVEARDSEDFATAVNRVFEVMERQIEDHTRKQRDVSRTAENVKETGRITRVFPDQRYGFVEIAGGPELYFTENTVDGIAYNDLAPGTMVVVVRADMDGPMGPQASLVQAIGPQNRMPRG